MNVNAGAARASQLPRGFGSHVCPTRRGPKSPMREKPENLVEAKDFDHPMAELRSRLHAAGCFAPAPLHHALHLLFVLVLYALAYGVLLCDPGWGVRLLALLAVAFGSVQAGFIAHEAGHGALTKRPWLAKVIGQLSLTFMTALCYSHFQKIHKCHHSRCNERGADIDLESGVFSLYPEAVDDKRSAISRFITRHQAYLIWPLVSLQGLTLKIDSLETLRADPESTRLDRIFLVLHFILWFGPPIHFLGLGAAIINYAAMTWMIGPYLGTIFIVNHVGTRIIEPGDRVSRLQQILLTTRNLADTGAATLFFGGLNSHVEHHLFPTIPSARLHRARAIVKQYCMEHALAYHETTWTKAAKEVFVYLGAVARAGAKSAGTAKPGAVT